MKGGRTAPALVLPLTEQRVLTHPFFRVNPNCSWGNHSCFASPEPRERQIPTANCTSEFARFFVKTLLSLVDNQK